MWIKEPIKQLRPKQESLPDLERKNEKNQTEQTHPVQKKHGKLDSEIGEE